MNTTTKNKLERIKSALYAQGVSLFTCKSSYPEYDAPRNLQGRTHYVDPDTLTVNYWRERGETLKQRG